MKHTSLTCRVVLDLRGVPWSTDPDAAAALLCTRPGVLSAHVDSVRRRAVVLHDSRLSLPELWNWLVECGAHCSGEDVPGHECCARGAES